MTASSQVLRSFAGLLRPARATSRWREHPLLRLLRYVPGHARFATLTAAFGVLGFSLSFVYPWLIGRAIDLIAEPSARVHPAAALPELWRLTAMGAATAILHAVVLYGRGHYNVHLGDGIVTDLRRELFHHLQRLSVGFYARERTGTILSRVMHDVHEATAIIYSGVIVVALDGAQLLISLLLLLGLSWKLTLACVGFFPAYGLIFGKMNPRVRDASERVQAHFGTLSGHVSEILSGQALVKICTAERREDERFRAATGHHHDLVVEQSHVGHLVAAFGEILVHAGTTTVIGYGTWLALHGELSPGRLTRFLGYVVILYGPVRRLAELNVSYQSSLSAIRRIFGLLAVQPAVAEVRNPRERAPTEGHVRFKGVCFGYARDAEDSRIDAESGQTNRAFSPAHDRVLQDVTLEANPGERIAIVGASGAGKTTLLSLLPRLYDVNEGRILVDGCDVRNYSLTALRSAIAVVQQESFLFTGSVRDNIAYGRPNASDAEVREAAEIAFAHEFIERLPRGYDTLLGERGVDLSGGQRQRISIARAVLRDPRVLILDEATSALDVESERSVQAALEQLMRNRTCFIIAHRLSTISSADRIVVLQAGRIVEIGTHAELLRLDSVYARLVHGQVTTPFS